MGDRSLTGSEGGVKFDFCVFCHESLAVIGVNTVRTLRKRVPCRSDRLANKRVRVVLGLSSTQIIKRKTVLRGGFYLKRRIYGLEAPNVAVTALGGPVLVYQWPFHYTSVETGRAGTRMIGQSINFI